MMEVMMNILKLPRVCCEEEVDENNNVESSPELWSYKKV
jgi:hypothetical protein